MKLLQAPVAQNMRLQYFSSISIKVKKRKERLL